LLQPLDTGIGARIILSESFPEDTWHPDNWPVQQRVAGPLAIPTGRPLATLTVLSQASPERLLLGRCRKSPQKSPDYEPGRGPAAAQDITSAAKRTSRQRPDGPGPLPRHSAVEFFLLAAAGTRLKAASRKVDNSAAAVEVALKPFLPV
jgi:hypothetical protein